MSMGQLRGNPVDILSMEEGNCLGTPSALVLLRPRIDQTKSVAILFDQEQVLRLRETLDAFLNDPQSAISMPTEDQVEYAFDNEEELQ
jgi:hypothetical protein